MAPELNVNFGAVHGGDQIALMDPSSCRINSSTGLQVFADLDLAALSDIGWEIFQPVALVGPTVELTQVAFSWPSTTGQTYTLQRKTELGLDWSD